MTDLIGRIAHETLHGGLTLATATEWSDRGYEAWRSCTKPANMMIVLAHCDPRQALRVGCVVARWGLHLLGPDESDAAVRAIEAVERGSVGPEEMSRLSGEAYRSALPLDDTRLPARHVKLAAAALARAASLVDVSLGIGFISLCVEAAAAYAARSYAERAIANGIAYEDMWKSRYDQSLYVEMLSPWERDLCALVRMHAACPTVRA